MTLLYRFLYSLDPVSVPDPKWVFSKHYFKQCDNGKKKHLKFQLIELLIDMVLTCKLPMWTQYDTLDPICYHLWPPVGLLLIGRQSSAILLILWKALWPPVHVLITISISCQGLIPRLLSFLWSLCGPLSVNLSLTNLSNLPGFFITDPQACIACTISLPQLLNN